MWVNVYRILIVVFVIMLLFGVFCCCFCVHVWGVFCYCFSFALYKCNKRQIYIRKWTKNKDLRGQGDACGFIVFDCAKTRKFSFVEIAWLLEEPFDAEFFHSALWGRFLAFAAFIMLRHRFPCPTLVQLLRIQRVCIADSSQGQL